MANATWGTSDAVVRVQRLSARVALDDSAAALADAKAQAAAGDDSWQEWVAEYERGDALILRLELTLELGAGADDVITASSDGFFVENHAHAPRVEQQIAELATGDMSALAAELARRGHDVDLLELGEMYVHVELDPEVQRLVRGHAGRD
jgi:hypothetical protein